jgi:dCTP deaminase
MIITGEQIKEAVRHGTLTIQPYVEENVQPASIDLTLGDEVCVYSKQVVYDEDEEAMALSMNWDQGARPGQSFLSVTNGVFADSKEEQQVHRFTMSKEKGFVIKPGILYLMHTHERICAKTMVSVLDGKSSIGRLGVVVHLTAGYGDPGFDGQYTLEVVCTHPVALYPGMKIAQMRFHVMYGEADTSYATKGHYVGGKAVGAVPSMAHKQF